VVTLEEQTRAYAYALAAVLLWSTVATAFKLTLERMSPPNLLLFSSLTSSIVLLLVLVLQGKVGLVSGISRLEILRLGLFGLLNPLVYYMVLFEAYSRLDAQIAQPLNYTWPIVLTIFSFFLLGQRPGRRNIMGVAIGFIGVVVISLRGNWGGGSLPSLAGILLALGSSVIWAVYWTLNLRDKKDPVVKLYLSFSLSLPAVFLFTFLIDGISLPGAAGAVGAAYIGVFEMGVTFVIWLLALSHSRTTAQIGKLIYLSPFISLVLIWLVLGERILPSTFLGLVLIVAGIVVGGYRDR